MKLVTPKLSTTISSSLSVTLPVDNGGQYLVGYRVSAYIKYRHSDKSAAVILDARVVPEKNCVEIFGAMKDISSLRCGQHIYFIELIKGQTVNSFSGYIDILP